MDSFVRFTLSAILCMSVFASADDEVSFHRRQIERNYADRMSQLYAKAEQETSELGVTDRLLWLEFITGDETPYSDSFSLYTVGGGSSSLSYFNSTDVGGETVTSSVLLAASSDNYGTKLTTLTLPQRYLQANLAEGYSLMRFAMFLLSDQSIALLSDIADSRYQSRRFRYQARSLLGAAERLHIEAREIEAIRRAALAALKRDEELKNEYASAAAEERAQTAEPVESEPGTVLAVAVDGRPICMIAGVEDILVQGETIAEGFGEGVIVARILPGSVELHKGRRIWTQKVGEEPSGNW